MYKTNAKILKWIIFGAAVLFFLVTVIGINYLDFVNAKNDEKISEITFFKDFSLQTYDGKTFSNTDAQKYKMIIYNGWGPWCGACVGEMPELEQLSEDYKDKGVLIVGIVADYASSADPEGNYLSEIEQAVNYTGITYPVPLSDERFEIEVKPTMNQMFPGTWVTDSEGNVIDFVSGAMNYRAWADHIDSWLGQIGG